MSRRGLLRGLDREIHQETRYARSRQRAAIRMRSGADTGPSMPEFLRNLAFERIEKAARQRFKLFNGGMPPEGWRGRAWNIQAGVLEMRCRLRPRRRPRAVDEMAAS